MFSDDRGDDKTGESDAIKLKQIFNDSEEIEMLRALLELPLLFYGSWNSVEESSAARKRWHRITGSDEMTTKVMCDAIRRGTA
jgi:hypothetical protein